MIKPESITDDPRVISLVVTMGDEAGEFWRVGNDGVTKIVAYEEKGQGAYVPWLAVYVGDAIAARVNCAAVEHIEYAKESKR